MDRFNKKTLVLGASENPTRYANMAIKKLREHGHDVIAIGKIVGKVNDVEITKEKKNFTNVDTVTLYLNPSHQKNYEDYLIALHPKRIIFNPGTENDAFSQKARAAGIQTIEACTLVLLSTSQF